MSAVISDCGQYRYVLERHIPSRFGWGRPCLFVMLNPSTADAEQNDPTIRRCLSFAESWGATKLTVVNLFALRSTDPKKLLDHSDPVGPENDDHIFDQISKHASGLKIAAWGASANAKERAFRVSMMTKWDSLGTTKDGSPRHPLYVKGDTSFKEWRLP